MERKQQNEVFADTNKNIKNLLSELVQSHVEEKELMKRKSKLQEDLSSREMGSNIKVDKLKSEISFINRDIKKTEGEILKNVKNHKSVEYF